jgi:CHASE2 domain-containing sensor protein
VEIAVPGFIVTGWQIVIAALLALLLGGLYAAWRLTPRGYRFTSRNTALAVAIGTSGTLIISIVIFYQAVVIPLLVLALFGFSGISQFIVSAMLDDERLRSPAEMVKEAEQIAARVFGKSAKQDAEEEGDGDAT